MSFGISIGDFLKLCEIAGRVYRNCRDCTGEYKSLTSEARALSNVCEDLNDKFSKIPENKHKQLQDAYEPCIEVLLELDKFLLHYNSLDTKTKRAWDRLKWDPEKSRALRDRLTSSTTMLNGFYSSLVLDNQVLILEALERLELDYRGGHREESVASIEKITSTSDDQEDEEDEQAWAQILRDLEDVGIASQDALGYRDMIVDWLVKAVNEGRLLEQEVRRDSVEEITKDLEMTMVSTTHNGPDVHHLDVPGGGLVDQRTSAPMMSSPLSIPGEQVPSSNSLNPLPVESKRQVSSETATSSDQTSSHRSEEVVLNSLANRPTHIDPSLSLATSGESTATVGASASATIHAPPIMPPPSVPHSEPSLGTTSSTSASDIPSDTLKEVITTSWSSPLPEIVTSTTPSVLPEVVIPPSQFNPSYASSPMPETPLPAYTAHGLISTDLAWIAGQAVAAWNSRDFSTAGKYLEDQLDAVEHGHTVTGTGSQPDRRILRHLIGVCNSFIGNFSKAKNYFESIFNGIYLTSPNLDDGDIAAARWLGDVCLHLREYSNTALAWGVAYEGSLARYGLLQPRTRRVGDELRLLDHWLFVFRRIENSFQNNIDPTNIFRQTHAAEKSGLIATLKQRLYERQGLSGARIAPPLNPAVKPTYEVGPRTRTSLTMSESFLLGPLISLSAWPAQWDPTFSPMNTVQLDRYMNTIKTTTTTNPLSERSLTSVTLGDSKKLHYVTKRGSRWLIQAVKEALQEMRVEHTESVSRDAIICTLNQHMDGYAFSAGVEITFKKLQFRSVFGVKIRYVTSNG
ncbi:hypothetical protein IQ06DRAFT_345063 [Phaeosphaeriaceae sp. SRC1lsM3a]|nr:hypothetical protein IQ06DRAFT_345063 [Stagonospora sp. SRC1lsM3a]